MARIGIDIDGTITTDSDRTLIGRLKYIKYLKYVVKPKIKRDCLEVLNQLKKENTVIIVTTRLFATENTIKGKISRHFLNKFYKVNNLVDIEKIYCKDALDKVQARQENGIDVMVDDEPRNIEVMQENGINLIIADMPYNKDMKGRRMVNWKDLPLMVG